MEIVRETKEMELTWVESMQCKVIVANVRQYAGGAYLKAVTKKEFYIGQHDMPGYNTFSFYIEGQQYFLCAENNEVFLMSSSDSEPTNARFLFHVEKASNVFYNIKSAVNPEMFLVSDESGKATMRRKKGRTAYDRQAWFRFLPDGDMVTTPVGAETIFEARTFEIQEAVSCN
ncbi:unnamed protein product [Porites lobata]|uniref:Uncharacterized protein n=1 Tax=Porites lobata TaxID=104759 RepID=A0ABN8RAP5_9CNID|nr:unnamed protein product [Porites lobata]